MKPLINLNNCKDGDILIAGEGCRYFYIGRTSDDSVWFPHMAKAANGDIYTFTNGGQMRNLPDKMRDIMVIVPSKDKPAVKEKPVVKVKMYVVKYTVQNAPTFDVMEEGEEIDDFLKTHSHKLLGIWEFGQEMTLTTKLVPKTV
jgi:hypothetical protein